jgi:hypothetical protein
MVLPTDEYQSRIDNLNFRLGELLNTPHILTATEINSANALLQEYRTLNVEMKTSIEAVSTNGDIGKITTNIGEFQQKIKNLEKELKAVKQEADTSEARKRSVERVEQDVSYHQLYIMDRPLRQLSIPTLLTLSVAFVFTGIFFLYKIWGGSAAVAAGAAGHGHGLSQGATAAVAGQYAHVKQNDGGFFGFFKSSPNTARATQPATSTGLLPLINMPTFGLSTMFSK